MITISEFLGIAAASAKIFHRHAATETLGDGLGTGGGENVRQIIAEYISQIDDAIAVQTAGDHGAVAKNAEMIAQTVAEDMLAVIRGIFIGPGETVAPFQEKPLPDSVTPVVLGPGFGETVLQYLQGGVISALVKASVP